MVTKELGFCLDCGADIPSAAQKRCPACRSPRLARHPELDSLSIAHLDCDAFYAAIEKRDRPELRDRPVIVGGGHRGVVSTACYLARLSGVKSAMPMFQAKKLCPGAVVLPPDMEKYRHVGRQIRELMLGLTPLVEPLSIDEAFLDLSGTETLHRTSPARILALLARRIATEVGITVSIGLSHNKFLAKIASDLNKPRGFAVIGRSETESFLADKPVTLIWGVGKATAATLARDGITRIGQLQKMPIADLVQRYGQLGDHLWHLSHGIDVRPIKPDSPAKSLSAETTFDADIGDPKALAAELWPLCETVSEHLKHESLSGQTVHLKLKTSDFRQITRQTKLPAPTQLAETLYRSGLTLLAKEAHGETFRLIGIGVNELYGAEEADPLDLGDPDGVQRQKVELAMDQVRRKLGPDSIIKGRSLKRPS